MAAPKVTNTETFSAKVVLFRHTHRESRDSYNDNLLNIDNDVESLMDLTLKGDTLESLRERIKVAVDL